MLLRLLYGANASDRDSNAFLQTLAGFVYIPSYDMPMACRTHNLQAQNNYHRRRHRRRRYLYYGANRYGKHNTSTDPCALRAPWQHLIGGTRARASERPWLRPMFFSVVRTSFVFVVVRCLLLVKSGVNGGHNRLYNDWSQSAMVELSVAKGLFRGSDTLLVIIFVTEQTLRKT